MQNETHDPDQPLDLYPSTAMLPLWRHLQAMEQVAAGDPRALALRAAGQRFLTAQLQRATPQQRRHRLEPVFAKLSAASIFVDEVYETKAGKEIQIESYGSAERIAQRLTAAGFNVIDFHQDIMTVETDFTSTSHLYALVVIDVEGLL